MTPKIKNILIFLGIGIILILIYSFFIKGAPDQASLTSTSSPASSASASSSGAIGQNSQIAQDFLSLLLNVKSITLDDSIFADPAFSSLVDSSIELVPDNTQGRPNPFAPIGADTVAASASSSSLNTTTSTNTLPIPATGTTPTKSGKTGTAGTTTPPKSTTPPVQTTN